MSLPQLSSAHPWMRRLQLSNSSGPPSDAEAGSLCQALPISDSQSPPSPPPHPPSVAFECRLLGPQSRHAPPLHPLHRLLPNSLSPHRCSFTAQTMPLSPSQSCPSSSPSFPRLSPSLPAAVPFFSHGVDEFESDPTLSYEKAMLAGAAAGVMEHLAMFPIDTVKTNMQLARAGPASSSSLSSSAPPHSCGHGAGHSHRFSFHAEGRFMRRGHRLHRHRHYASLLQTTRVIVRQQGVRRLYRGVTAVVIGAIPSHAVNYAAYEFFKRQFGGDQPGHHLLANALAGSLATCAHDAVITPLDVVKQRLQMVDSRYSGVTQAVRQMVKEEGIAAFYASYPTTVLMNVPFMAVHFAGYEAFKLLLTGSERQHGVAEELLAGGLAGACAGLVSTPLDVVKTRIQTQRRGEGVQAMTALQVVRQIARTDGLAGFMRGGSARVLYFMPSAAICWTTYETVKRLLREAW